MPFRRAQSGLIVRERKASGTIVRIMLLIAAVGRVFNHPRQFTICFQFASGHYNVATSLSDLDCLNFRDLSFTTNCTVRAQRGLKDPWRSCCSFRHDLQRHQVNVYNQCHN